MIHEQNFTFIISPKPFVPSDLERSEEDTTENEQAGAVGGSYALIPGNIMPTSIQITNTNIDVCPNNGNLAVTENAIQCDGCKQRLEQIHVLEMTYKDEINFLEVKNKEQIQHSDVKYKELQTRFLKLTVEFSEISLKYKDAIKLGHSSRQAETDETDNGETGETLHDDMFSKEELRTLKGLPLDKRNDSTFILQCLKFAYKSDLSILCNKSLMGTYATILVSSEGEDVEIAGKDPLTPEKVNKIKQLFTERLSSCDINAVQYGERIKESKVNHLLGTGLVNIRKKFK